VALVAVVTSAAALSPAGATDEAASAGFVVHEWGGAKAHGDTVCPQGRSLGYRKIFEQSEEGQRREGEADADYVKRMEAGGTALANKDGKNLCANPGLAPDPYYRTMDDTGVVSYGINFDGLVSTSDGAVAPGTCAHDDFTGVGGEAGVDNQYLRLTGCTGNPPTDTGEAQTGWLPPPQEALENTMLEGGWGILIELKGVDDYENDDSVEVGVYANADPIVLSATREPIPYATYAADQDPRFRGVSSGKIVDGVLTTEPADVRFHWLVAGMHLERPLSQARIRATFTADGVMEGYLAGYTPVEALYDFQYGFRNATNDAGEPAPAAMMTAIATGAASAMNRTCNGAYEAMYRLADGDPDPKTGRCTSLSTQYFFRATPAFIAEVETSSRNDSLLAE
jgi:hypothetical protein